MRKFALLILFGLFTSCGNNSGTQQQEGAVYDLDAYFHNEAVRLRDANIQLEKTITREGKQTSILSGITNWLSEFQPFLEATINKPSMKSSYSIDSIPEGDSYNIIYKAKDKSVATQLVEISFAGGQPDSVTVINDVVNYYYTAKESLTYVPKSGYRISVVNKPVAGKEVSFIIDARMK